MDKVDVVGYIFLGRDNSMNVVLFMHGEWWIVDYDAVLPIPVWKEEEEEEGEKK